MLLMVVIIVGVPARDGIGALKSPVRAACYLAQSSRRGNDDLETISKPTESAESLTSLTEVTDSRFRGNDWLGGSPSFEIVT
jgi:hypothetical protein